MKKMKPLRILLAEDRAELRTQLECFLRSHGHQVTSTENGKLALTLSEKADPPFEVLISDYEMPEMDGATLIRELATKPAGEQFGLLVLYTGHDKNESSIQHLVAEVGSKVPFCYIHKLAPTKELLAVLESVRVTPEKKAE